MREMFSKSLVDLVKRDSRVYLLSGDHGYALFDSLRKEKPDHFINAGVAEQNMVGVAAGLSKLGFFPIIYGLSAFVPIRVLEQIKIDFCYENIPGLFVGDGAGVVYSHLGTSHQSTEDISALRAIPNISILSPCDAIEFKACFEWAVQQKQPVYLRMGKADLGAVHTKEFTLKTLAPIQVLNKQAKTAILATGSMVPTAIKLVQQYQIEADIFSVPVIKPMDPAKIFQQMNHYEKLVILEEHSVHGGLGAAVSEIFASHHGPRVHRIGINDRFSQHCGTYDYLMKEHELDLPGLNKQFSLIP